MKTNMHFWSYLAHFFLEWNVFPSKVVEKIKTHNLCSVTFFFPFENRAAYEIMWKNIVEPERPQMTIWHMLIACGIPKASNTHSKHVIFIAFLPKQQLHESAWMLCYMYIACLVEIDFIQIRKKFFAKNESYLSNIFLYTEFSHFLWSIEILIVWFDQIPGVSEGRYNDTDVNLYRAG